MSRNWILAAVLLVLLSLGAGIAWRYRGDVPVSLPAPEQPATSTPGETAARGPCLTEDEYANYEVVWEDPASSAGVKTIRVFVRSRTDPDKTTEGFDVDGFRRLGVSAWGHRCHFYVTRFFKYEVERPSPVAPGGSVELWRYTYDGVGEQLYLFAETDAQNVYRSYFYFDWAVDEDEKYLALIQWALEDPHHALVIKDLETGEDVFTLPLAELFARYPQFEPGDFTQLSWNDRDGLFHFQLINSTNTVFELKKGTWEIVTASN